MARIDDLERVIGTDALEQLAAAYGGRRLVVPHARNMNPGHRLAALLGMDAALRLAQTFAGETVEIPKCDFLARRRRDEAIMADRKAGASQAALARRYRMSERWVREVLKRADQLSGKVGI